MDQWPVSGATSSNPFGVDPQDLPRDLGQTHERGLAGDSTLSWEILTKVSPLQMYSLGSEGRFWHPEAGILRARYVQFVQLNQTFQIGGPCGIYPANSGTYWQVTNDLNRVKDGVCLGLIGGYTLPGENHYGWVITEGSNIQAIRINSDMDLAPGTKLGFGADGLLIPNGDGAIFAVNRANLIEAELGEIYKAGIGALRIGLLQGGSDLITGINGQIDEVRRSLRNLADRSYVAGIQERFTADIEGVQRSIEILSIRAARANQNEIAAEIRNAINLTANYANLAQVLAHRVGEEATAINVQFTAANQLTQQARIWRDEAGAFAESATSFRNEATLRANEAGISATASSEFSSQASVSATNAGLSASASQISRLAAEVAEGNSLSSATLSDTKSVEASDFAASAAASALLASQYSGSGTGAANLVQNSEFDFTNDDWTTAAPGTDFVATFQSRSNVFRVSVERTITSDTKIPFNSARSLRITYGAYFDSAVTRLYAGLQCLDADSNYITNWYPQGLHVGTAGWRDFSYSLGANTPYTAVPAGTQYVKPIAVVDFQNLATAPVGLDYFRAYDVTESSLVTAQAQISTTAAANASSSAATATTQAGLSATYRTESQNYRDAALGYRDAASGFATAASGSATNSSNSAAQADGFRAAASNSASLASGYMTTTLGYRDAAEGFKNTAQAQAGIATTKATEADGFRASAVTASNQSATYRNESQGFRNEAQTFRNTAETQAGIATTQAAASDAARAASVIASNQSATFRNESQTFRNQAEAFKVTSETQAGISSAKAAEASASAATAYANMVLSSSIGGGGINLNPKFTDYPGANPNDIPTGWQRYGAFGTIQRVAGLIGGFSTRMNCVAPGGQCGVYEFGTNWVSPGDWILVETEWELLSGTMDGTGILLRLYANGSLVSSQDLHLRDFPTVAGILIPHPSGNQYGEAGRRYSWRIPVQLSGSSADPVPYLLGIYAVADGNFSTSRPKEVICRGVTLRPMTPSEIANQTIIPGLVSASATHTSQISTLATADSAQAASISTLNANFTTLNGTVAGHTGSITTLNTSVSTHTSQIGVIAAENSTQATSISTLNSNYSTLNTLTGAHTDSIATITADLSTQAGLNSAQATSISSLNASVGTLNGLTGAHTASISTLNGVTASLDLTRADHETRIDANEASITIQASAISGLGTQYVLALDSGSGSIVGFRAASGSGGVSEFIISADHFAVDSAGQRPFEIVGGTVYIKNAVIQNQAIDTPKLQQNATFEFSHTYYNLAGTRWVYTNGTWNPLYVGAGTIQIAFDIGPEAGQIVDLTWFCTAMGDGSSADNASFRIRRVNDNTVLQTYFNIQILNDRAMQYPFGFVDTDPLLNTLNVYQIEWSPITDGYPYFYNQLVKGLLLKK